MKKKLFSLAVVIICLSLLTYGTVAYFTAEDSSHNIITSGNIDVDLLEWADEARTVPFPEDGVHGIMPGAEVTKIAEVKNVGSQPAWVRVSVSKSITFARGVTGQPDLGLMRIDFNDLYWIDGGDGYYYYSRCLLPGEVTVPLFASVSFDISMGNAYQNSTAAVDVKVHAVQSANNGATVQQAQGWPDNE